MASRDLGNYINHRNIRAKFFSKPAKPGYDINNLSATDITELLESIECDLSPENLSCDGEASPQAVHARLRELKTAKNELNKINNALR